MTKIKIDKSFFLTRYAAGGRDFSNVDLSDAILRNAGLRGVDLRGSDLRYANLSGATMHGANLSGANLSGANLSDTNLSGANLDGANLSDAYLEGTVGNGRQIKTLRCGVYAVLYTAECLWIGCQTHPIQDWWRFNDDEIDAMGLPEFREWWLVWKPILRQIIEVSPATPTGHERKEEEDE